MAKWHTSTNGQLVVCPAEVKCRLLGTERSEHVEAETAEEARGEMEKKLAENYAGSFNTEAGVYAEPSVATKRKSGGEGSFKVWGNTPNLRVGSNTPWGKADNIEKPAEGIVFASTPGHGGIKLSPERNRAIPESLRKQDGWYEQDCEAQIVGMHHPDAFPHLLNKDGSNYQETVDSFKSGVKNYFPEGYEEATGEKVRPEESSALREQVAKNSLQNFRARNASSFVSTGAGATTGPGQGEFAFKPEGYEVIVARKEETGESAHYLVPRDEAVDPSTRQWNKKLVIDPERHLDVSSAVNAGIKEYKETKYGAGNKKQPEVKRGDDLNLNLENMTPAQADRAFNEMSQKYRWENEDGSIDVETKFDYLKRTGVTGKRRNVSGDREVFHVDLADGRGSIVLSSSEFKALDIEDTTTEESDAFIEYTKTDNRSRRARKSWDNTFGNGNSSERSKAKEKYEAAREKHEQSKSRVDEIAAKRRATYLKEEEAAKNASLASWEKLRPTFEAMQSKS